MRAITVFLSAVLMLSGCNLPGGNHETFAPGSQSTHGKPASQSDSGALETLPDALSLPQRISSSDAGYELELLTPAQYDMQPMQEKSARRGFHMADFFLLGRDGKYAVANQEGRFITDFLYASADEYTAPQGVAVLEKDGRRGLLSLETGQEAVAFAYESVELLGDSFLLLNRGEERTLQEREGRFAFSLARGDECLLLGENLVLLQDGMLRLYAGDVGTPIANFACDEIRLVSREWALLAFRVGERWGLIDEQGEWVLEPLYEAIGHFSGEYASFTHRGKMGVLDHTGDTVLAAEWEDLIVYAHSVSVYKDEKWGAFTNYFSEMQVPAIYDFVGSFDEGAYASFERGGKYGLIDREGNEVIQPRFEAAVVSAGSALEDGYFALEGNSALTAGIVGGGKVLIPNDHVILWAQDGEAYNLVMTPREKWGYADRKGVFVIDPQFENASPFISGRDVAIVKKDGHIGLIDRSGKMVLETLFGDLIAYNPETMVLALAYTNEEGETKVCLAKLLPPQ